MQRAKRELPRELCETVCPIGFVRRSRHILGDVELVARVTLDVERVDAARRRVHHRLDIGSEGGGEQPGVQPKVRRTVVLVKIHVPSPTVISGEVEDDVHPLNGASRYLGISKISADQLHGSSANRTPGVRLGPTAEVVHNADRCAPIRQGVDKG
jgi:hypothetical protein